MNGNFVVQSVGNVIRSVLPKGPNIINLDGSSAFDEDFDPDTKNAWDWAPEIPTDLFAVVGQLCRIGGVIGFFDPSPWFEAHRTQEHDKLHFGFDRKHRDLIDDVAWRWRGGKRGGHPTDPRRNEDCKPSTVPPPEVQDFWNTLLKDWNETAHCGHYVSKPGQNQPPDWWIAALSLLMISDLVCVRIFRNPMQRFQGTQLGEMLRTLYFPPETPADPPTQRQGSGAQRGGHAGMTSEEAPRGPASLTVMVDTSIVCVMPKMRIAAVGTTMRNVSRNLALLPGRGEMRCYWDMTDSEPESEDHDTLDILLIPAPFRLDTTDFQAVPNPGRPTSQQLRNNKPDWDSYEIRQSWIEGKGRGQQFIEDCVALARGTHKDTGVLNGVILPEYVLTHDLFDELCNRLKADDVAPNLEFVVAGASDNCHGRKANTLLTRVWQKRDPERHITNSRRKQHRWRIDRRQIETYALGAALNPMVKNWWENSPIGQRELYFHRFRADSAFAALICEELARSDICHDVLRAIGPNLVFALLMDSAQIPGRWPAQYATSLAEDPGCAVLSMTSFGLVERANRLRSNGSRSIALWKDDTGNLVQIDMPQGEGPRGVLLSLWSEYVRDQTITGKRSDVRAWRYSSHCAVAPNFSRKLKPAPKTRPAKNRPKYGYGTSNA